jgi:hypothetical protein
VLATIAFPAAFAVAPNGVCAANGVAIPGLSWTTTTTDLVLSVSTALAASTTYEIGYLLA